MKMTNLTKFAILLFITTALLLIITLLIPSILKSEIINTACAIIMVSTFVISLIFIKKVGKYSLYFYLFLFFYLLYSLIGQFLGSRGEQINIPLIIGISTMGFLLLIICVFLVAKKKKNSS